MSKRTSGFTLVELTVVLVIIGVLAAIGLPRLAGTQGPAKLAAVKSDVRNLETAEEAYMSDKGRYGDLTELQANGFTVSPGTTMTVAATASGYSARAANTTIDSPINDCSVRVGAAAPASTADGVVTCP